MFSIGSLASCTFTFLLRSTFTGGCCRARTTRAATYPVAVSLRAFSADTGLLEPRARSAAELRRHRTVAWESLSKIRTLFSVLFRFSLGVPCPFYLVDAGGYRKMLSEVGGWWVDCWGGGGRVGVREPLGVLDNSLGSHFCWGGIEMRRERVGGEG